MGLNCNNNDNVSVESVSHILSYVKLEDVMPELDGYRTRIIYDSAMVKDLIVLQYIIPHFSRFKDTYLVLYSEALYYKFKKRICSLIEKLPELERSFENLKVIKIGLRDECAFGELVGFVKQGNLQDEFNGLMRNLENIGSNDVLILYGSVAYYLTAIGKKAFKRLIDMFSILPEGLTLFGFRSSCCTSPEINLIGDLYDVVVHVRKDEQSFDDSTFCFRVDCQFRGSCNRHGKLRIENGLLKSII